MFQQEFKELLSDLLFKQVNVVRKLGNDAVHTNFKIQPTQALHALKSIHNFSSYVVRVYSGTYVTVPRFDETIVPVETEEVKTKKQLKALDCMTDLYFVFSASGYGANAVSVGCPSASLNQTTCTCAAITPLVSIRFETDF